MTDLQQAADDAAKLLSLAHDVKAKFETMEANLARLQAENGRLREALEYYVAECSGPNIETAWRRTPTRCVAKAALARQALTEPEKGKV